MNHSEVLCEDYTEFAVILACICKGSCYTGKLEESVVCKVNTWVGKYHVQGQYTVREGKYLFQG